MSVDPYNATVPPDGPPVKATTAHYRRGAVVVLRTEGSLSEWIVSSEFTPVEKAR